MRQTIKDIEVNTAYRWFLGLTLAGLNIKKLVKIGARRPFYCVIVEVFLTITLKIGRKYRKRQSQNGFVFGLSTSPDNGGSAGLGKIVQ